MTDAGRNSGPAEVLSRAWPVSRQWRVAAAIALVVVILIAASLAMRRLSAAPPQPPPVASTPGTFRPSTQQLAGLETAQVAEGRFHGLQVTDGRIALDAGNTTPIYAPYSGQVLAVLARPGDLIARGAPLARIEATEFAQASSDLATASAQLTLARASEVRKHALYTQQGGSQQDWQQAQADLATAQSAVQAARGHLRGLGASDADLRRLESGQVGNEPALLVSPVAGVVIDRQVAAGQYLQAGQGAPLFTLADTRRVWLVANVREQDAPKLRRGQIIEATVAAYPDRRFRSRIDYVAAALDPQTHRLTVRATLDNSDGALTPESFASFRILTDEEGARAPAVPDSAVVYEGSAAHVWVLGHDAGGTVLQIRPIRVGQSEDHQVQVLEGLKVGERIVTRGSLFIDRAASGDAS